jgi:peptidyl-prolyl cis-trans isomerase B (cyclophilin B)
MFRKKYFIVCFLLLSMFMVGCKSETISKSSTDKPTESTTKSSVNKTSPIVTIEMENGAKIKIELYPASAPNTVNNFISLVQKGYYNGLIFHRVIPDFMIQGGDPKGTGTGGPGYSIKGEFTSNGFTNNLKHTRGVISMARGGTNNDSAGSQFFIVAADSANNSDSLDGKYASFGKVIEGIEEVDKIVNEKRNANNKPLKEQKMRTVTVDTFGVKYEEVQKAK